MGKGVVYSGGAKGEYLVTLDYGTDIRDELLTKNNARKADLESQITLVEGFVADIEAIIVSDTAAINAAIDTYNATEKTKEDREALESVVLVPLSRQEDLRRNKHVLGDLNMQLAGVKSDISMLNSAQLTETKTVWCADYTEDASGSVGIIEINAEKPTFVIAPGGEAYSYAYGQMIARELQSGPQAYYNAAILPGVQKWKPTYRSGVIKDLDYDNDLADVDLDPALSLSARP